MSAKKQIDSIKRETICRYYLRWYTINFSVKSRKKKKKIKNCHLFSTLVNARPVYTEIFHSYTHATPETIESYTADSYDWGESLLCGEAFNPINSYRKLICRIRCCRLNACVRVCAIPLNRISSGNKVFTFIVIFSWLFRYFATFTTTQCDSLGHCFIAIVFFVVVVECVRAKHELYELAHMAACNRSDDIGCNLVGCGGNQ